VEGSLNVTRFWVPPVVAGLAGLTVGLLWPPIILDNPFWRSFWSGPPVAGLFAVVGAFIAYAAARVAARTSRQGAEREEWWARAEWALNLARSDKRADRLIGLRALEGLQAQATESEFQMIIAVVDAVAGDDSGEDTGEDTDVDITSHPAENGWRKRWARWLSRSA
jgi:hypothetical protein